MPHAIARDGTQLFYERFAPTGLRIRLPLVLIAGWATDGRLWRAAAERGTAAGYEVITTDGRGTGRSGTPLRPWSTATLASDVVAVLDDAGIARAHVAAPSLGGMVAQELALRHPGRVGALVLAATSGGLPRTDLYRAAGLAGLLVGRIRPPSPRKDRASTRGSLYGLLAAAAHSTWSRLPALALPVQVQHGSADRLVSVRAAHALVEAIPRAELEILHGAGHALILERPEETMRLGLSFLARHEPTTRRTRVTALG